MATHGRLTLGAEHVYRQRPREYVSRVIDDLCDGAADAGVADDDVEPSVTVNPRGDGAPQGEPGPDEMHHGVKFVGADGWIYVTRGKIEVSDPQLLKQELPAGAERLYVSNNHMGNFFDCVRSRKKPASPKSQAGPRESKPS